jgi:hypothetical protein
MAPLTRYTWATMKSEVIRRLGGRTESTIGSRVEYWLEAAQLDMGLTYHHFELDKTDTSLTLATGTSTINLPSDCYIVLGVGLRNPGLTTFKKWVTLQHLRYVQANFSETNAVPSEYARFGSTLQFNCNSDQNYPILLRYYKLPSAADFSGGSPELSRFWDEHLIEAAVAKAQGALWRPDLAAGATTLLQDFLEKQVQPQLLADVLADRPTVSTANRTHGGAQG